MMSDGDDGTGPPVSSGEGGGSGPALHVAPVPARQTGGLPELAVFELPVYVKRHATAIELLAGARKVNDLLLHPEHRSELHLRPADPLSHPVLGERHTSNSFLVTLQRNTHASSGSAGASISAEIKGHIKTTFRWEAFADFQYVSNSVPSAVDGRFVHSFLSAVVKDIPADTYTPASTDALASSASASASSSASAAPADVHSVSSNPWVHALNTKLNLAPLVFSHIDKATPYAFRGAKPSSKNLQEVEAVGAGGEGSGEAAGTGKKSYAYNDARSRYSLIHAHHTYTEGLPVPATAREIPPPPVPPNKAQEVLDGLKEAFEARPVWTILSLSMYLARSSKDFRFQLPAYAYFLRGGCFRNCWVRLGWDPRLAPYCAPFYQVLDIKIPPTHQTRVPSTIQANTARQVSGAAGAAKGKASGGKGKSGAGVEEEEEEGDAEGEEDVGDLPTGDLAWTRWCGGLIVRRSLFQVCDLLSQGLTTWVLTMGGGGPSGAQYRLLGQSKAAGSGSEGAGTGTGGGGSSIMQDVLPAVIHVAGTAACTAWGKEKVEPVLDLLPRAKGWSAGTGWIPKASLDALRRVVTTALCLHIDRYGPGEGGRGAGGMGLGMGHAPLSLAALMSDGQHIAGRFGVSSPATGTSSTSSAGKHKRKREEASGTATRAGEGVELGTGTAGTSTIASSAGQTSSARAVAMGAAGLLVDSGKDVEGDEGAASAAPT